MPKIFNTSVLGILLATIAFYMIGFLWYGILFDAPWMELAGITQADAEANAAALGSKMYIYGLLISFAQVFGLNWLINRAGLFGKKSGVEIGLMVATFIGFPVLLYGWLYEGGSFRGDILDLGHLAVGYAVAGMVLGLFRKSTP